MAGRALRARALSGTSDQLKRRPAELHTGDGDYDDDTRSKTAFFDRTNAEMWTWARTRES
ncbi:hypothetical protein BJF90_33260 [Pseudonocardia sp. CNS-004]|nr:hypothetical protein BJF90_33260 [Pseudonocardia sp. CNS-004]